MNKKTILKCAIAFFVSLLGNSLYSVNADLQIARCQANRAIIDNVLLFLEEQDRVLNEVLNHITGVDNVELLYQTFRHYSSSAFKGDVFLFTPISPGSVVVSKDGMHFDTIPLPAIDLFVSEFAPHEAIGFMRVHVPLLIDQVKKEHYRYSLIKQQLSEKIRSLNATRKGDVSEAYRTLVRMAALQVLRFDVTKSTPQRIPIIQELIQLNNRFTELPTLDFLYSSHILCMNQLLQIHEVDPLDDIIEKLSSPL